MAALAKQNQRLKSLHKWQKQKRLNAKQIKDLTTQIQNEFKSCEYIIEILESEPNDAKLTKIIYESNPNSYKFYIVFRGVKFPPEYFYPQIIVTVSATGIKKAKIMFPKCLIKYLNEENKYEMFYTLSSKKPQFSRDFVDDFHIVRVFFLFAVLLMLEDKIEYPLDAITIKKYDPECNPKEEMYPMHYDMKLIFEDQILFYKHDCEDSDLLEPLGENSLG